MLYGAFALLVLAVACAVVLFGQQAEPPLVFVAAGEETAAATDAWRSVALDAHGDVKRLRHGIASALEHCNGPEREAILRDALADTWRPESVRLNL